MTPTETAKQRLLAAHRECARHFHYLFRGMGDLASRAPLTAPVLEGFSDEEVKSTDQFIYRFANLQDAIGARFFPALLAVLEEPFEDKPMLDRLNRLEKLGFVPDASRWPALREIRNRLAHE